MDAKVVGFYGGGSYMLPYLLARTARMLGNRVAFVDKSGKGIASSICADNAVSVGGIGKNKGVIYTAVSHTQNIPYDKIGEVDYVFVYFGDESISPECEEVYFVTDCTIMSMEDLLSSISKVDCFKALILMSYTSVNNRLNALRGEVERVSDLDGSFAINLNSSDEAAKLSVFADTVPNLKGLSSDLSSFVSRFFEVDYEPKVINNAFKQVCRNKG